MKKTIKKYFALVAMIVFAAVGMTSCGGSSGSDSEADEIPTDGLLGDLPMLTAKYCNKIVDLREKMFSGQLTENELKEARAEFDETEKERDAKLLLARQALNGKEVPVEVQEGLAISINGNLKIDSEGKEQIFAVGKGEMQKGFTYEEAANTYVIPIDTDGKAIKTTRGGFWESESGQGSFDWKKGEKFVLKVQVSVGDTGARSYRTNEMKRWAKLAKFVVMDKSSDEYKKLMDQFEADKKAEEIEAAKKIVGEN
jgi:hypothetical protein